MRLFNWICLSILFLGASALQAQGILLVQQETRDGKTNTNQVQITKTHMRAESRASGENIAFLFDAPGQIARLINIDKKTYTEMTRAQFQEMRGAMAQLEEQLKNMTPEQRAMVEQMMRGRGGMRGMQAAPQRLQFRPGGSDKVGQWSCTKYEGYRGQDKAMEVCAVDPKELGLSPSDFDVPRQLMEFLRALVPQTADQTMIFGTPEDQGFSGVSVRTTTFANGQVLSTSEIKEIRRETFPPSTFSVPAGFTRQEMRP